jgi:hypothetical protein
MSTLSKYGLALAGALVFSCFLPFYSVSLRERPDLKPRPSESRSSGWGALGGFARDLEEASIMMGEMMRVEPVFRAGQEAFGEARFEAMMESAEGEHGGTVWKSAFGFGRGILVFLLALGSMAAVWYGTSAEEESQQRWAGGIAPLAAAAICFIVLLHFVVTAPHASCVGYVSGKAGPGFGAWLGLLLSAVLVFVSGALFVSISRRQAAPSGAPAEAAPVRRALDERFRELESLKEEGLLTEEEYRRKRRRLLEDA